MKAAAVHYHIADQLLFFDQYVKLGKHIFAKAGDHNFLAKTIGNC